MNDYRPRGFLVSQSQEQFGTNVLTICKWFLWGFRWLAVIVFSILFLVGIAVELPWKMLVCLAIIPVVGIFVPKKVQPWVWLAMTLLIVGAWVWIRLPGSNAGHWRVFQYESEPLSSKRQMDPAVNAAAGYEALLDMYDETIFEYPPLSEQSENITYNGPWKRTDYPRLAEWVEGHSPAIEQLLEISRVSECRFDVPVNLSARDDQLKRLNQMKSWARLLLLSANLDLAEGKTDGALEKKLGVLRMAQHLYQQQTLLDQAAAFHIELLAFRALYTYAIENCRTIETLETIEQSFERLDTGWAKSWATIVDREKLFVKNIMALFYEVDENGNTRIAHSAMYALQEGLGYAPRKLFLRQHEMNRLAVIGLWLSLPASPDGIAEMIDKRFDYYSLLAQKGAALPTIPIQYSWRMGLNIRSVVDWFAIDRVKYFWALHGQDSRHLAIVDLMRIFSALKKYHLQNQQWPADLELLKLDGLQANPVDPVHGKPFVYRRTGDGFRLYSLGPNDTDDNGVNNPKKNKDDIVFWPRRMDSGFEPEILVQQVSP